MANTQVCESVRRMKSRSGPPDGTAVCHAKAFYDALTAPSGASLSTTLRGRGPHSQFCDG